MPVTGIISQPAWANAITAGAIATDAIGADELATSAVTEIVGAMVNTGGTATLAGAIGDVANSSIAARLTAIAAYVDTLEASIGTVTNTGGPAATVGAVLGDPKGSSLVDLLFALGAGRVSKGITYTGAASYPAYTVSGTVAVKVVGSITSPLTNDAATTSVGTATSVAGLIDATAGSALQTTGQIWVDSAPSKFENFPTNWVIISEDIAVDGDAALVGGTLMLNCWWFPVVASSTLVAA